MLLTLALSLLLSHTGPHPLGLPLWVTWELLSDQGWRKISLLWPPFFKLFIKEEIMILLELLLYIDLYGFWAAQKWASSRVVVAGTVVNSFISFWCFKDLKLSLVAWTINASPELAEETTAIHSPFSVYVSHCVTLGLPVPADIVVTDRFSLQGAPEGGRHRQEHSHFLVLFQLDSWHDSWKQRHDRDSVRTGTTIIK